MAEALPVLTYPRESERVRALKWLGSLWEISVLEPSMPYMVKLPLVKMICIPSSKQNTRLSLQIPRLMQSDAWNMLRRTLLSNSSSSFQLVMLIVWNDCIWILGECNSKGLLGKQAIWPRGSVPHPIDIAVCSGEIQTILKGILSTTTLHWTFSKPSGSHTSIARKKA